MIDYDDLNDASAEDIVETIRALMSELNDRMRHKGGMIYERWKAYPYGNIMMSLVKDHDYLGSSPFTAEALARELDNEIKDCNHVQDPEDFDYCKLCNKELTDDDVESDEE